jgi:uridine kinase
MQRKDMIEALVAHILALDLRHPVRVGISGITASGKTTLGRELTEEIRRQGRPAVQTSIDDFHNPSAIRYRQGRTSARGYYEDAYDFAAVRTRLLEPLGPEGNRRYQLTSLELKTDVPLDPTPETATDDLVLVVDGTFTFRPEINECWDFRIFVDTDFELALQRGSEREAKAFGSAEKARQMFEDRYHAASRMYLEECQPAEAAQAVVRNNEIQNPELVIKELPCE